MIGELEERGYGDVVVEMRFNTRSWLREDDQRKWGVGCSGYLRTNHADDSSPDSPHCMARVRDRVCDSPFSATGTDNNQENPR